MSEPFIGEIKIVGFNFAPRNFAFCNGQILPISQYTALFAILGTTYGGNGVSTFALPNLQGSVPMGFGTGPGLTPRDLGEAVGTETVTLIASENPAHTHTLRGGDLNPPNRAQRVEIPTTKAMFGSSNPGSAYKVPPVATATQFAPSMLTSTGGSQPHENRQPYLALNFVIALNGVFPSRN